LLLMCLPLAFFICVLFGFELHCPTNLCFQHIWKTLSHCYYKKFKLCLSLLISNALSLCLSFSSWDSFLYIMYSLCIFYILTI
jgi:hypothetical protein